MAIELGKSICEIIKVSKKGSGVLCFFASYKFLNECCSLWRKFNILSKIENFKEIHIDKPNNKTNIIKNFNDSCIDNNESNRKGGVLFSVLQGSSSEGIDFKDDKARMVIVI